MAIIHTYPIGSTSGLVINSVAFMGEKGGVPVAIVCLIVTNGKGLCRLEAVCRKLRREVVLRVQHGSVLEVNRHRVTLQDLCCLLGPPRALFLNHYLIDTKKKKQREASMILHGRQTDLLGLRSPGIWAHLGQRTWRPLLNALP